MTELPRTTATGRGYLQRSDLRDRIAAALREAATACDGGCGKTETDCDAQHPIQATILTFDQVSHLEGPIDDLTDVALTAVQPELDQVVAERDSVYRERAHLLAHLAAVHESHIGYTDPDVPTWPVLTVETPTGQMCWHINPTDLDLFDHVTWVDPVAIGWDGHTTEEKYERLRQLAAQDAAERLRRERATCPRCNTGDRDPCGRHLHAR